MSRLRPSDDDSAPKSTFRAVVVYAAVWAALTAVVAFAVTSAVDGDESVTLPPVRAIDMTAAARIAGCEIRRGDRVDASVPVSGPLDGAPARPGFYDDSPPPDALVEALRRGVIVIHYRRDLPAKRVDELRVVQRAVPSGTIVTPNDGMRHAVAVAAWRRLLSCTRMTDETLDALRLFRGRYIGGTTTPP